ncbi:ABC transporter permease [Tersicoccus phoenicis]|uniref:ABC transporter permease n=1 Tax=Tersicoccus phoenicis TaxID=554083 RepID=A0A1R1L6B6_9MICC|nr:ABC transporter permease [Tersicoccus phoenicis]OMH23063.1 ABC transporter permease [Tersicoccus phoenicis]
MTWVADNASYIAQLTGLHLVQSVLPLFLGLIISIPIAQFARLSRPVSTVILSASSILYTIPSLALFIILPVVLGTGVLELTNVIVALTIYAVALLVRSCVDAFGSVDDSVRQAAVAVGYTPVRRFFTVDLPLSVPVLIAGLRVVSVSNISLVSVGAVIGIPNLGLLFTDGLQRNFFTPLLAGIVITLLLALVMDALLVLTERALTPWTRADKAVRP